MKNDEQDNANPYEPARAEELVAEDPATETAVSRTTIGVPRIIPAGLLILIAVPPLLLGVIVHAATGQNRSVTVFREVIKNTAAVAFDGIAICLILAALS